MEIKVDGQVYNVEKGQNAFDLLKLINPENKKRYPCLRAKRTEI